MLVMRTNRLTYMKILCKSQKLKTSAKVPRTLVMKTHRHIIFHRTNKQTWNISAFPVLVFLGLVTLDCRDFLVRDDVVGF